jgi:putative membrane protein
MMENKEEVPVPIKKDLILREKLALQRTVLANQTTFLAFLRTSMYFLIAGLSIQQLVQDPRAIFFEILLFTVSAALLVVGIINYLRNNRKIRRSEIHIGDYKLEYEGG